MLNTSSPLAMSEIVEMHGMRPYLGWSNTRNWELGRKLWLVLCARVAQYSEEFWENDKKCYFTIFCVDYKEF